jgi:site-specific recombinase XerD
MPTKDDGRGHGCMRTGTGQALAQLLLSTRDAFLHSLERQQQSQRYLRQSRDIIDEYAHFCRDCAAADPWQLRQEYLEHRATLRSKQRFAASYLQEHGRQLGYFLHWYQQQVAAGRVLWGELSVAQERAYWETERGALPYRRRMLSNLLPSFLGWLQQRPELAGSCEAKPKHGLGRRIATLLDDYFEQRHRSKRGRGYCLVLTRRAQIVTCRHLIWLEQRGQLPPGTTAADSRSGTALQVEHPAQTIPQHLVAKVDLQLPERLRRPLLQYLEHLVYERELGRGRISSILRTNLTLCRHLARAGHDSFARLRVADLDQVVGSLLSAPGHDLLRRRRQVQTEHSRLRGFLRYLHRRGLLGRDLARVLISPPCYRASQPPTVLSELQVRALLESVDRGEKRGRRAYAILMLMTTYGLRPIDVCQLQLDNLHWQQGQVVLVQSKTGRVLTLPLLPEVGAALSDYLRQDRRPGLQHRRVFVGLAWPHRPLRSAAVSVAVTDALQKAGLDWARPKDLRATLATHLLRQGEALSSIQEVLGHRTVETTQRYAVTDVVLLRELLDESER